MAGKWTRDCPSCVRPSARFPSPPRRVSGGLGRRWRGFRIRSSTRAAGQQLAQLQPPDSRSAPSACLITSTGGHLVWDNGEGHFSGSVEGGSVNRRSLAPPRVVGVGRRDILNVDCTPRPIQDGEAKHLRCRLWGSGSVSARAEGGLTFRRAFSREAKGAFLRFQERFRRCVSLFIPGGQEMPRGTFQRGISAVLATCRLASEMPPERTRMR